MKQTLLSAHDYRLSTPRIYCRVKVRGFIQDVYYDRSKSKWLYCEPKFADIDFAALEKELIPIVYYDQLEHHPHGEVAAMPLDSVTMDDIAECSLHIGPRQMAELQAILGEKPKN